MRTPLTKMRLRMDLHHHRHAIENPANGFGHFPQRNSGVHQGWDLEAAVGTQAYAIAKGNINYVRSNDNGGYGKYIIFEFDFKGTKLYALYGHLSSIESWVKAGVKDVPEGTLLGKTGKSGNAHNMPAGEEHLHFEVRETPIITQGLGLLGRKDPGEIFGYGIYSCFE